MQVIWPFAGRAEQLAEVRRAMRRPGSGGVVVAGPAGVGKSRLAAEARREIETDPRYRLMRAHATHATNPVPLGALAHLLLTQPTGDLLVSSVEHLAAQAGSRRLVLTIDDAHLLDPLSAAVVQRLVEAGAASVLLTLRTGEGAPDEVVALWRDDMLTRVDLEPFELDEVISVLAGALGGSIDAVAAQRLWRLSQGNALFLRELVTAAVRSGTLKATSGTWQLSGELQVSPLLGELIDARIGHLDAAECEVAELVAFGEPLDATTLIHLTAAETVEAVEGKQLITAEADQRRTQVRLAHPLYGEVIRKRCPTLRRRRRLRQLAEAVEATGAHRREDVLRIATWRLDSDTAADPVLLTRATQLAWSAHDTELATRLGRAALEAGAGVDAGVTLAVVLAYRERPDEAEEVLAKVADRAVTDQERTMVASARAHNFGMGLADHLEWRRVLDEAERAVTDEACKQKIMSVRAGSWVWPGDYAMARKEITRVLEASDPDPIGLAQARALEVIVAAHTGQTQHALDVAEATLRTADQWRDTAPLVEATLQLGRTIAELTAGRPATAAAVAERAHAALVETGSWPIMLSLYELHVGMALRLQGRVLDAAGWLAPAAERTRPERSTLGSAVHGEWAHVLALSGELDGAERVLSNAERRRNRMFGSFDFTVDRARCALLGARGEQDAAIRSALDAAAEAGTRGAVDAELTALYDVVRLGSAESVVARLGQLAESCDGAFAPAVYAHARAAASSDGERLLAVSTTFEKLGLSLYAAEAATHAGQAWRAAGRAERARAAEGRASLLTERCQGVYTPTLAALNSPGLTSREREIAQLAATGLSSRDISERLRMSSRTVDNHLRSVYRKLGLTGRAELATTLGLQTG